jgi:hypothetical protein
MIKSAVTTYPYLAMLLPNDPEVVAATATLAKKLWAREEAQIDTVLAAMAPVKHTITISTNVQ